MKPLTFALLRILADGDYHSGTMLGQALNLSRASISNALRDSDRYGVKIHRIRGRGYRWLNPVQWLGFDSIRSHFPEIDNTFRIEILDIVESTNTALLQRAASRDFPDGGGKQVLVAELQTKGRGRRGRSWISGLGDNLTFSILWPFQLPVQALSGLSLAVGVAIIRALTSAGIHGATLKWPNDILFQSRKLAGVLIELQGDTLSPGPVIIGIGINLKLSDALRSQIDQAVIDIVSIAGKMPDRNLLLAILLRELANVLKLFDQHGFQAFQHEWMQYHAYQNKPVSVDLPNGSTEYGIACGVAADGALLLATQAGAVQLRSGEVSLRAIE